LVDKAVSQQDYDDADAALKQVDAEIASWRAQVETARINLGYTKVTAPISGRIGKSSVTDGALVTAFQPTALATIQQLDPIYVDVTQSTSDLLRLRRRFEAGHLQAKGADLNKVKLILEDGTTYPQEGTLQFRDVTVEPSRGPCVAHGVSESEGILCRRCSSRRNQGRNKRRSDRCAATRGLRIPKASPMRLSPALRTRFKCAC
jgi:membrane fusion protein (multidrug efflux system)